MIWKRWAPSTTTLRSAHRRGCGLNRRLTACRLRHRSSRLRRMMRRSSYPLSPTSTSSQYVFQLRPAVRVNPERHIRKFGGKLRICKAASDHGVSASTPFGPAVRPGESHFSEGGFHALRSRSKKHHDISMVQAYHAPEAAVSAACSGRKSVYFSHPYGRGIIRVSLSAQSEVGTKMLSHSRSCPAVRSRGVAMWTLAGRTDRCCIAWACVMTEPVRQSVASRAAAGTRY